MSTGSTTVVSVATTGATKRDTRVARWIGLYVAGSAGAIQLLDIFADRLQLPEQAFVYVVILAIVGLPITAAGAFVRAIAVRERHGERSAGSARRRSVQPRVIEGRAAGSRERAGDADAPRRSGTDPGGGAIAAELELAFSHLQIAKLRAADGDDQAAHEHFDAFLCQAAMVRGRIDAAMDEVGRERRTEDE